MIDSSGLFALEPDVPLVVPEVNPYVLADYRNRNVIAIADSLTSQLLAALKPLIDQGTVAHRRHQYVISVRTGKKRSMRWPDRVRSCLTAYRLMKMISLAASWRSICCRCCRIVKAACAERRIVDEVRKILQDDGVMISASVVQSPVFYGHAQMVSFEALRPLAAEEAREAFSRGEDIVLSEETDYPTQVGDASGNPQLSIGCVHNDYGMPEQIQFWSVADNVRFGGALMAVKIAEKLVQEYLY